MAEGNPEKPKSTTKQLSDTDTSDEEQINLSLNPQKRKIIIEQYPVHH